MKYVFFNLSSSKIVKEYCKTNKKNSILLNSILQNVNCALNRNFTVLNPD